VVAADIGTTVGAKLFPKTGVSGEQTQGADEFLAIRVVKASASAPAVLDSRPVPRAGEYRRADGQAFEQRLRQQII
jgi:hypothetical protein